MSKVNFTIDVAKQQRAWTAQWLRESAAAIERGEYDLRGCEVVCNDALVSDEPTPNIRMVGEYAMTLRFGPPVQEQEVP